MKLLFNIYSAAGIYLFFISLMMLFDIVTIIRRRIKEKQNPMNWWHRCKFVLCLVFVCIFGIGYAIYVVSEADTQSRNVFLKIIGSISSIAFVTGILEYTIYRKNKKRLENKNESLKRYVIQAEKYLAVLFWIFSICCIGTTGYSFMTQQETWVSVGFLIISVVMLLGALNVSLWKIEVIDTEIIYRSTFGRIRKYNFKDITKGVYKKSGAFSVYMDDQIIFTFDDSMEISLFIEQMGKLHIPIWSYEFAAKMKKKS